MSASEYSRFGVENPLTRETIDPVQSCVGNTIFEKSGVAGYQMEEDACKLFMSARCAANWDSYCDAYMTTSKTDQGGYMHINKEFLSETAKKKYCRMSSAPGTHCAKRCQSFLPQGQSSVQICDVIGTQNWLDTKDEYDMKGDFPQSARLNPISPIYMGRCPEVCDASNPLPPDALTADDKVLNNCIKYGACGVVLNDLAYNLVKNGKHNSVSNPAFNKIIELAKLDQPVNPNVVAQIATTYGLPDTLALEVLRDAKYGGVSNQVQGDVITINSGKGPITAAQNAVLAASSAPTTVPASTIAAQSFASLSTDSPKKAKDVVSPVGPKAGIMMASGSIANKSREGFRYVPNKISTSSPGFIVLMVLLAIVALLLVYYFVFAKKKSMAYWF